MKGHPNISTICCICDLDDWTFWILVKHTQTHGQKNIPKLYVHMTSLYLDPNLGLSGVRAPAP